MECGIVLDTGSTMGAEAALVIDRVCVATVSLAPEIRSAQGLIPLLDRMLAEGGMEPRDIDWLALAVGPGSFTGLRVAMTVAKMLSLAGGVRVVGIDTFDALDRGFVRWISDQGAATDPLRLWALIDAQRGDLFARSRLFEVNRSGSCRMGEPSETRIVSTRDFCTWLEATDWVTGPGVAKLLSTEAWPVACQLAPPSVIAVRITDLVAVALDRVNREAWSDPLTLVPNYQRSSAAEEKRRKPQP